MTPEQKAAYMNAQVVCALAEIEAMKATNAVAAIRGEYPLHQRVDFLAVPERYGIHHNAVITWFSD